MESVTKRIKTHEFENDEEAEVYMDSLLLGKPELPPEIWVKILSSNPALSVQDIQHMCRVNSRFKQICDTGIIWDKIYIRQFGTEAFLNAQRQMPDDSLARLFTTRFMKIMSPAPGDGRSYSWKLDSPNEGNLQFHFDSTGIMYSEEGAYRTITMDFRARAYNPNEFEFVQQFARDLRDSTFVDHFPSIFQDGDIYVGWSFKTFVNSEFEQSNFEQWVIYYLFKHKYYKKGGGKYVVHKMQLGQCVICNDKAKYVCSSCKHQSYCGESCQLTDWKSQHFAKCGHI